MVAQRVGLLDGSKGSIPDQARNSSAILEGRSKPWIGTGSMRSRITSDAGRVSALAAPGPVPYPYLIDTQANEMSSSPAGAAVELVEASPDDASAIADMAARIWPDCYGPLLSPEQINYMLGLMYSAERIRGDMIEGVDYLWIVLGEERIGYLAAGPVSADGVAPLHKCYLLAKHQGQGCGRAALTLLFERLSAQGARRVELRVNRQNRSAIAFYHKLGFEITEEDCLPIGQGYVMDDYLMRRDLAV